MNWDWTFVTPVSMWQSIATISVIIIALSLITRMAIRFWPRLHKAMDLFDALGKLPTFMERTNKSVASIEHELTTNRGSSVKDAVGRVETKVDDLNTKVDEQKLALDAADLKLRHELEDTKPHVSPSNRRSKNEYRSE